MTTRWENMGGFFLSNNVGEDGYSIGVYYDGTVSEVLGMMYMEAKAGAGGGVNWSSLGSFNIGKMVQDHVYRNSSLYQYHRDQMRERQMDEFQENMEFLGIIDPTGAIDAVNGVGYLFRGQYGNMTISAIAMFPYVGDLAKLGKYAKKGSYVVYEGLDAASHVKYVGITKRDAAIRFAEHAASGGEKGSLFFRTISGAEGLTKREARILEQTLINQHGLQKNGGMLLNQINSIAPKKWFKYGIK